MNYYKTLEIAEKYLQLLKPFCERIEIAGSMRRECSEVNDIEFVCIPKTIDAGLFADKKERHPKFIETIESLEKIKGEPTGRYTQRKLPEGLNLDIFICERNNWGYQLAIRTGPASYSRDVIIKGLKKYGLKPDEGFVWYDNKIVPILEEKFLFQMIREPWTEPRYRISTGSENRRIAV